MFELATLGLLQQEPLHGYRLKQQLELFMSGCISVNYGTIYPMLKRLEKQKAISVLIDSAEDGASGRKIYSITDAGRSLWKQKMMEHPHESWVNARSRFMIKFFFFSHLEPTERLQLLEHRLIVCRLRLEAEDMQTCLEDPYQMMVWQRFMAVLQDEVQWLSKVLEQEQAQYAWMQLQKGQS